MFSRLRNRARSRGLFRQEETPEERAEQERLCKDHIKEIKAAYTYIESILASLEFDSVEDLESRLETEHYHARDLMNEYL